MLGILIALKRKEKRLNSFLLELYPFLFHVCFMIFYWSPSVEVTIVTEMVCMGVYLVGTAHHLLFVVYEIINFLVKLFKLYRKNNQVDPKEKHKSKS